MSKENPCVVISEDSQANSIVRYLFEEHGVRGEIMHMHDPLVRLFQNHNYPDPVKELMMELAVAAVLMATTLKANGTVTVQLHGGKGNKAVRLAFINIDKDLNFYGSASLIEENDYSDASFRDLVGSDGILVISVFPQDGKRYQGIVSLDTDNLSQALENYFKDSEQLATTLILHHDLQSTQAGGMMLQIIPNIENNIESLDHLTTLSRTLSSQELFELSLNESLRRLFWNDKIRVFTPEHTEFHCICSKERCLNSIEALPVEDIEEMAQDSAGITITCQNCGCVYHLSQSDIQSLLKNDTKQDQVSPVP